MRRREHVLRWAAPVAFLAGLTIAVLLVRSGLHHRSGTTTPPTAATPTFPVRVTTGTDTKARRKTGTTTGAAGAQFYTVQAGDTYGSIATKYGTSVQQLEGLNPGISSTSLSVGQRIRVK